ncbi:MAG: hypothetical protein CME70_24080 [Halobacteriovorax sp.]|nr:hypothetical protein [Halobacteriovorax sp.]
MRQHSAKMAFGATMKLLILLFLSFNLSVAYSSENPRVLAHDEAIKAVHDLHFVKDGRGMTLTPDAVNMFAFMAKLFGLSKPRDGFVEDKSGTKVGLFTKRWGLVEHDKEIKGFFNVPYKKMNVGAMGCAVCHSGKAAGQYIIGLGNKNIDVGKLAKDVEKASKLWKKMTVLKRKSKEYKRIENDSMAFAKRLGNEKVTNLTQGLVPISMIMSWFYRAVAKTEMPDTTPRGAVKVPHFWGYGKKRFVGQFTDGFGNGTHAGWGLAVELAGTQTAENVRKMIPKIEHAENILADILPPKYPFKVNQIMAARGKKVFNNTCFKCHGTYERDAAGLPIYKEPKHIEIDVVKTDRDRLRGLTPEFLSLVERNPIPDYIQHNDVDPGYFAPRLEGVWARFPYLHNGSIPNMMALLTHPLERPKFWDLQRAGERDRFSEELLGLTLPKKGSREYKKLVREAKSGARDVYSTDREGQSSKGHWFRFSDKLSNQDKKDLIEYLKTI